jgi:transcriptional regulator with XRE-family HTH domain
METKNKHIVDVDKESISNYLKKNRLRKGYNQKKLASLIGVSSSCISKFETNASMLSEITCKKACEVLNVNYDNLINNNRLFNDNKIINKRYEINKPDISHILTKDDIILMLQLEGYKIYKPIVETTYVELTISNK